MVKNRIPYIIFGSLSFYNRKEIKDIISYLRFAVDHNDYDSYSRSLKNPLRYCGNAFIDNVDEYSKTNNVDLLEATKQLGYGRFRNAQQYVRWIKEIKKIGRPYDAINFIRGAGYDHYLNEDADDDDSADNERIENLVTFQLSAEKFDTIPEFLEHIDNVISSQQDYDKLEMDCVKLMTIHKSKGLEFKIVFGCGISDGLLPHSRSVDIEEERRLCYVLVTRTKDRLFLSSIDHRNEKAMEVSPFIYEMNLLVEDDAKKRKNNNDNIKLKLLN
jgi:DNA helicase-2/ATP-dependent DNA helicase PcrA